MSLNSVGTATQNSIIFNSGLLTVNGLLVADISDVKITNSFVVKDYRTLNSIKKRALRRATLEQSVTFTLEGGQARALYGLFYSSSSPSSGGQDYTVLDGQQLSQAVYVTCYEDDDPTKAYQYQLVTPVLSKYDVNLATEEFANVEVEVMCKEIVLYVSDQTSN